MSKSSVTYGTCAPPGFGMVTTGENRRIQREPEAVSVWKAPKLAVPGNVFDVVHGAEVPAPTTAVQPAGRAGVTTELKFSLRSAIGVFGAPVLRSQGSWMLP